MGAIAGNIRVLYSELIEELNLSADDVEAVVARESREMARRERLYRGGQPMPDLRDRTVFLVDDGLATGSTAIAAARLVRRWQPAEVVIAAPVASLDGFQRAAKEADECLILTLPNRFTSVGEWYADFRDLDDAEIRNLLRRARRVQPPL